MPDNYKAFSNGKIRESDQSLNPFYPKFALHKVDEKLNAHLISSGAIAPYVGNSNFYIIEPNTSGWGTEYLIVYASDYTLSVVVHFEGSGATVPVVSGVWRTFNGSFNTLAQEFESDISVTLTVVEATLPPMYNYTYLGKFAQMKDGTVFTAIRQF